MNTSSQPLPMFSGFPPTEPLIASLITISNEISSITKNPPVQIKNITAMTRRIKLLSPLFTEAHEIKTPLLPSTILCFTELLSLLSRVKLLIQGCIEGSYLWSLIQTETLSKEFNTILKEIGKALEILPLQSLNIEMDVKEQVELLHKQVKRANLLLDPKELIRRTEVLRIIANTKENNDKNFNFLDVGRTREIFSTIGLKSSVDYAKEISKLKAEAVSQGGTGGPIVVSRINSLVCLLTYVRSMIFSYEESEIILEPSKKKIGSSSFRAILSDVPDGFRCPISQEIMKEPVTVATGHTYDRDSITKWVDSGRKTCPKSGYKLTHFALIPNYNLKSLIHQWHQENNIHFDEYTWSSSEAFKNRMGNPGSNAVRWTSEFLVGKLATASSELQCRAAYETRLLAKSSMDNRKTMAEVGAIPFLLNLLSSEHAATQENAMTALLNLSIHSTNKILIMEASGLLKIIEVLESGKTMEARENAAATIGSLTLVDDYKASIGAHPRVIRALLRLLKEGATTGKRDAVTALTNLALYYPNQTTLVREGVIPLLNDTLFDDKAGITDDALALLVFLSGSSEGSEEISRNKSKHLMPFLIDLLRFGSSKGKENSVILLLALSKDGVEVVRHLDPQSFSLLRSLVGNGSSEARERASRLLRLLIKCCSNPTNF
ncbi:U-box domain-containing protein 1-like [Amaranthus tricolor]|uniref:U-box domain-containing protein 1-like n=1 Tax=Amaranthus tricolor TaxID=29722 RepID=UPI0025866685|nr:U-box domain-containing protein 1-like [Amaranthus tricolor]